MLRAGMDTKAVLQKCMDSIFGSALPYEQTSDAELKALAHAVTNGGIIQKHLSGVCLLAIHMSHTDEHDILPPTIAQPQSCKRAPVLSTQPRSILAIQFRTYLHSHYPVLHADEDRNRLYAQKMVNTFGYILLTASDEAAPARPFFPISAVVAAILCIPGQSPHKNRHILFSQVHPSPGHLTLLEAGCSKKCSLLHHRQAEPS